MAVALTALSSWAERPSVRGAATPAAGTTTPRAAQPSQPAKPPPAAAPAEAAPPDAAGLDPRLLLGGGALAVLGVGALLLRRRGAKRTLVVDLMLDDMHEGRFAVALSPEARDSVAGEVKLRLEQSPPAQLESGLTGLPREVTRRFQQVNDSVRVTTSFSARSGERLRVLVLGRSAPQAAVTLQVGGTLSVKDPAQLRVVSQERVVQVLDTDLTVTFDLRQGPKSLPRPGPARTTEARPPETLTSPAPRRTTASAPVSKTEPIAISNSPAPSAGLGGISIWSTPLGAPAAPAAPALPSVGQLKLGAQGGPLPAGVSLDPLGDASRLARELFLEGKYEEAAVLYGNCNDLENQARCYLFLGQVEKVASIDARLAYQRRDLESAVNHYLRAKDHNAAARVLRELGRPREAAKVEAEAKLAKGQKEQAAELYLTAGEKVRAAELFLEVGAQARAQSLFIEAGAWGDAARLCAAQGDFGQAAELFLKAELPVEAAVVLLRLGRREEAAAQAQKVPVDAPGWPSAATVLARFYAEAGQSAELAALGQRAVERVRLSTEQPEVLGALAAFLEGRSLVREALAVVEALAQASPSDATLATNLARLRAAAAQPAADATYVSTGAAANRNAATAMIAAAGETHADVELPSATTTGPMPHARPSLPEGNQRYRIDEELGRGAMGIVYRGTDTLLGRPVALKMLPQALARDPKLSRMFLDEARSLAALNHPHIVQIYDMGELAGTLFLAMEFVTGQTLEQALESRKRLSVAEALAVTDQVAQALEGAHAQRLVHRDVKPANVMLGDGGRVKLMDFGIAAAQSGQASEKVGTPYYMAPEQATGAPVDGRTDLYALGVMLYRLLSGTLPFESGDILASHVSSAPPPLASRAPDLPAPLCELVMQLLAKDPAARVQSASDLRARLAALNAGPSQARAG